MRQALLRSARRGMATSRTVSVPPPTGGWNARDPISGMGKADAIVLENWLCIPGAIRTRPGRQPWATGLGGPVESLMEWAPASGNPKLFAATPTAIFDATAQGAVGAAVQTGLSNGRWQHVNFSTPAGHYLVIVNGADAPRVWTGAGWPLPTITGSGLTPSNLVHVMSHMNRLWFIERGTLKVWYLDTQAIAGTATLLDLGALATLGGELVALDSWTRDGGDGTDDLAVFVTSRGQVITYQGTDPANASTFTMTGRYKVPPPIGRRCTYKLGGELLILTSEGPYPLTHALGLSSAGQKNASITDKISAAFQAAYKMTGQSFGWEIEEHGRAGFLIINVPLRERAMQHQYVFGVQAGGWSKFTGLNAGCWGLLDTELFYGGNDGTVYRLDAETDDGGPIAATYQHAFTDLRVAASKRFLLARPRIIGPRGHRPAVQIKTDLDLSSIPYRTVPIPQREALWDTAIWDVSPWARGNAASEEWQSVEGSGSTVSVAFRVAARSAISLNGVDLSYEVGGLL